MKLRWKKVATISVLGFASVTWKTHGWNKIIWFFLNKVSEHHQTNRVNFAYANKSKSLK